MIDICQWRASIGRWNCCQIRVPVTACCCTTQRTDTADSVTDIKWLWSTVAIIGCVSLLLSGISRDLAFLLLLSGDVELNPGPTTVQQVRRDIQDSLQRHFADLKEATRHCIGSIADRLYSEGLISLAVKDTQNYDNIIDEFKSKITFCRDISDIQQQCELFLGCFASQGGPTKSAIDELSKEWRDSLATEPVSKFSSMEDLQIINDMMDHKEDAIKKLFILYKYINKGGLDEKQERLSLQKLHQNFCHLMQVVKLLLRNKMRTMSQFRVELAEWVENYMNLEPATLSPDLDDIFKRIHPHYDFIDCSLIVQLCKEFLKDQQIIQLLTEHLKTAKDVRSSTSIHEFKTQKLFFHHHNYLESACNQVIAVKLHRLWNDIKLDGLYLLIEDLMPNQLRQSLMKHITIESRSVSIRYTVRNTTADSLIAHVQGKLQFMRLIGIFGVAINNHPILQEDENTNFAFELALIDAARAGHNDAVEFLLELGIDANYQNNSGVTALMLASQYGHCHAVKLLLKHADPNIRHQNGATAIILASENGYHQVVNLLLKKRASINIQQHDGATALMLACDNGHHEVVQLLLMKEVTAPNGHHQNCSYSSYSQIRHYVNPNIQRQDGATALMLASKNGNHQIVELLLNNNAYPNSQLQNGSTALILASENGHHQVVELLLEKHAYPDIQRQDGSTALILASENGHHRVVELLLRKHADFNIQREDGATALMLASQNGHQNVVSFQLTVFFGVFLTQSCGIGVVNKSKIPEINIGLSLVATHHFENGVKRDQIFYRCPIPVWYTVYAFARDGTNDIKMRQLHAIIADGIDATLEVFRNWTSAGQDSLYCEKKGVYAGGCGTWLVVEGGPYQKKDGTFQTNNLSIREVTQRELFASGNFTLESHRKFHCTTRDLSCTMKCTYCH